MRHHVEGHAFVWHCKECGNEQREDVEPYEEDCWGGCRYVRYSCNNIDCKAGPMAHWLKGQLYHDRCHLCKSEGLIRTMDGDEMPCPVEECLASELLTKDYISERIYSPSYHRAELDIAYTLPGRIDPRPGGRGKVVNRHHGGIPEGAVYVGRGSLWGNPFSHRKGTKAAAIVDSREDAIEAYRLWLTTDLEIVGWPKPSREQVTALAGRTLVCYCAPKWCHGDVLLELAAAWSEASP